MSHKERTLSFILPVNKCCTFCPTPSETLWQLAGSTFCLTSCSESSKRIYLQCKRYRFDPWVGNISLERKWQPNSMPRKSHGQRPNGLQFRRVARELDTAYDKPLSPPFALMMVVVADQPEKTTNNNPGISYRLFLMRSHKQPGQRSTVLLWSTRWILGSLGRKDNTVLATLISLFLI